MLASRPAPLIFTVASLAALALQWALWPGTFPLDDAYITLHNARGVLLGGSDTAYDGSPLVGATSLVHLFLVAAIGLALPLPIASQCVTAIGIGLYAAGLDALARQRGGRGMQRALVVVVGFAGYVPYQVFNGLETGLALAAVAWSLVLADRPKIAALCGLLPFIRPELAFLAVPLMAHRLWQLRADPARALASLLVATAVALPWVAWLWIATGQLVPATAKAKVLFFGDAAETWPSRIEAAVLAVVGCLFLPLFVFLGGLRRAPAGWCAATFLVLWIGASVLSLPSALFHNHFRYLMLLAPVIACGLAAGLAKRRFPASIVAVLLCWAAGSSIAGVRVLAEAVAYARGPAMASALFVRDHLPAEAVVLVHDAGRIAWAAPQAHLIDLVGLKTPSSIEAHRALTRAPGAWGPALDRIARCAHATHLIALADDPPFWANIARNLRDEGWRLTPLLQADTGGGYEVFRIEEPEAPMPDLNCSH